eukprot:3255314-Ditylum_brightwellii.AAC.1
MVTSISCNLVVSRMSRLKDIGLLEAKHSDISSKHFWSDVVFSYLTGHPDACYISILPVIRNNASYRVFET